MGATRRYLLLAADGVPSTHLCSYMESRCRDELTDVHILVARSKRSILVADPALGCARRGSHEIMVDRSDYDTSQARLDSFKRALADIAFELTGEVLGGNLVRGVRRALDFQPFDEVLIAGQATAPSRGLWRRRNLLAELRRSCDVPVTPVLAVGQAA